MITLIESEDQHADFLTKPLRKAYFATTGIFGLMFDAFFETGGFMSGF